MKFQNFKITQINMLLSKNRYPGFFPDTIYTHESNLNESH